MARQWSSDHDAPPSPPGIRPDPTAATGPPWRRLMAVGDAHAPPRMARWLIVAGIVLFAGWIAATVGLHAVSTPSPSPAPGYLLTASDAHFTATFPRKPLRIEKTAGTTTIIVYLADLPDHGVEIIRAPVPASGPFSLDRAINVTTSALPGGGVASRHSITYHGQPAETQSSPFWGIRGRSLSWRSARPPTFSRGSEAQPPASPTTTRFCSTASVYFIRKPAMSDSGSRMGVVTMPGGAGRRGDHGHIAARELQELLIAAALSARSLRCGPECRGFESPRSLPSCRGR